MKFLNSSLLQTSFSNKQLLKLHPFLDDNGILRVGGRLTYADLLTFNQKHPILLPSKNRIVQLLLKREHIRLCHAGPPNTLFSVRL